MIIKPGETYGRRYMELLMWLLCRAVLTWVGKRAGASHTECERRGARKGTHRTVFIHIDLCLWLHVQRIEYMLLKSDLENENTEVTLILM